MADDERVREERADENERQRATLSEVVARCWLSAVEAIVVVDERGTIVAASPAAERLTGYDGDVLVGRSVDDLVPDANRSLHPARRQQYAVGGVAREMAPYRRVALRRADGSLLPVDVRIAPVPGTGQPLVAAAIRDASAARRTEDRLSAQSTLSEALLRGIPFDATLALIAGLSRRVVVARTAVVLRADDIGDALEVSGADGEQAELLMGRRVPLVGTTAGRAHRSAAPIVAPPGAAVGPPFEALRAPGAALFVPMQADEHVIGVIAMKRAVLDGPFVPGDLEALERFATAAAVAVTLSAAQEELGRLERLLDRERIARDLHDTVIQSLFATAMRLEATVPRAPDEVGERIVAAVNELDGIIRRIREVIFGLEHDDVARDLADRIEEIVGEVGEAAGLPIEVSVEVGSRTLSPEVRNALLAVLRELLTNVVRHAAASKARVAVVTGNEVVLEVADDGIGMDAGGASDAGHGLRNVNARARHLGGRTTVGTGEGGGTVVEWRVPCGEIPP